MHAFFTKTKLFLNFSCEMLGTIRPLHNAIYWLRFYSDLFSACNGFEIPYNGTKELVQQIDHYAKYGRQVEV